MDDTTRIKQVNDLIKMAEKHGTQYLDDALKIAQDIEDLDDKPSYIAIVASQLAGLGSIADIDRALQLGHTTRPIDKWQYAFQGVFLRLKDDNKIQRALDVLNELELAATEFETSNYDYSIKSTMWQEIGDMYKSIGKIEEARKMWINAVKMAQIGQDSKNPQDAVDSFKELRLLSLVFLEAGYSKDAVKTANTITHGGYKRDVVKRIEEYRNANK